MKLFCAFSLFLFPFVACSPLDKKTVTNNSNQQETESFNDFFTVFCQDSLFRESRTVKPFPYIVLEEVEEEDYDTTHINEFPFTTMEISQMEAGTTFILEKISPDSCLLRIQIEDTGIQFRVIFSRKSKSEEWYAVECKDVST